MIAKDTDVIHLQVTHQIKYSKIKCLNSMIYIS